jgi:hypothetical protein
MATGCCPTDKSFTMSGVWSIRSNRQWSQNISSILRLIGNLQWCLWFSSQSASVFFNGLSSS